MLQKIEVEIMAKVKDLIDLQKRIKELGAVEADTVNLIDEYFDFPEWKLRSKDKRIRIRHEISDRKSVFEISFKGPRMSKTSDSKPDTSFVLENEHDVNALIYILEQIGLQRMLRIKQVRTKYSYDKFNLELDRIDDKGNYLTASCEIVDPKAISKTEKELWARILLPLGFTLNDVESRGKIGLILNEQDS